MSHRRKNKHRSRHHTHAVKPASLPTPGLPPLVVEPSVQVPSVETNTLAELLPSSAPTIV